MANELTRYIPTELSDSEGNVRYPHTLASVTFMDDGKRVQPVLARLNTLLDTIETIASSSEIDSNTALVTAAALAEVKALYTELNSDLTEIRMPDNVKIIPEGSGASVKYYLQMGADTASKKLLGEPTVALASSTSVSAASGAVSKTYTAAKDGKVLAVVMAVSGNDSHTVYYGPSVTASATSGSSVSKLKDLTAMGHDSVITTAAGAGHEVSGHAVLGVFQSTMKAKGVLTVKITPFDPRFMCGYAVIFITL